MAFYVYILHCSDGSYYTGHTDNIEKRIQEHYAGALSSCYTFKRRPLKLVFSQDFPTRVEALAAEQQIKGWSRNKKEAMIRGDWAEVSRLARSSSSTVLPVIDCSTTVAASTAVRPISRVSDTNENIPSTMVAVSTTVRPELVEGCVTSGHGSTSSPRTDGEGL